MKVIEQSHTIATNLQDKKNRKSIYPILLNDFINTE